MDLLSIIGSIASILGLILTWFAYRKIKDVNEILYNRSMQKQLSSRISGIMRYDEKESMSVENIENIKTVMACLKTRVSIWWCKNRIEKEYLKAIKNELNKSNPNVSVVKTNFKSLKATMLIQGE